MCIIRRVCKTVYRRGGFSLYIRIHRILDYYNMIYMGSKGINARTSRIVQEIWYF